jgi:hypothetical protein
MAPKKNGSNGNGNGKSLAKSEKKEKKEKKEVKAKEEEVPQLVVTSRVKDIAKNIGLRVAEDFVVSLNKRIYRELKTSIKRCQGNNRQTLREVDTI